MPELSSRVDLQVFGRSSSASPIVVEEFSILQVPFLDGQVAYQPNLRLRDTSSAAAARVVALTIDVPQLGSSVFCAANRVVGAVGWSAFNPPGDMHYGFLLVSRAGSRAAAPTVRVTAVLSDGLGVSFTASGTTQPYTHASWYDGEDTGVRCQP